MNSAGTRSEPNLQQAVVPAGEGARFPAWLPGALLVLMTLLAYQPLWHAGFIWDDDTFLVDNPMIKAGNGLYQYWCTTRAPDYFPLTSSSLWLEWRLWGNHALGYHLVNVLLHAASAVLFWSVFRRLKLPGAWLAAAIFALHPVNVESVAWITERKNTLTMFFYALTLLWYLRSEKSEPLSTNDQRPTSFWYGLSLVAFALALLSKTSVVTLPVVLLGLAWWRRGKIEGRDVWRTVPFFALAGILALVTEWFQSHRAIVHEVIRTDSLWGRLAVAGSAVWFYLYKAFCPANLMFVYPRWSVDASKPLSYLPGLLLVVVLAMCWWKRRRWGRPVLIALGYFVLMLLPVLGFLNIYFMRYSLLADHWQYFAILGPIALVAAWLADTWESKPQMGMLVGGALLLLLGGLTWRQARIYADQETLWRDTIAKNPDCWLARNNLSTLLLNTDRVDEAMGQLHEALRLNPDYPLAHLNLGLGLRDKGQIDAATAEFQKSVLLDTNFYEGWYSLGTVMLDKGQLDRAIEDFERALSLKPEYPDACNNLGLALFNEGRVDEAIKEFESAVRIDPDYQEGYNNLGNALLRKGQTDKALGEFQEAVRLKPDYAEAHHNLGLALANKGRVDEAISEFQQVVRLMPGSADAVDTLGNIYFAQGRFDEAIAQFQQAIRLEPRNTKVLYHLGQAFDGKGRTDEAIDQYQQALRINPNAADTHHILGIDLGKAGRADEAIGELREAARLKPGEAEIHDDLGNTLDNKGQIDAAIVEYEEALRLATNSADAHSNLGAALGQKGDLDVAIDQLQEAVRLNPNDPLTHYNLAMTFIQKNRTDDAVGQLREALRLKPDFAEARTQLNGATGKSVTK